MLTNNSACETIGLKTRVSLLSHADYVLPHVIVLDLDQSLLSNITEREFSVVQKVATDAKMLLWATAGGLLDGKVPEAAMVAGLLRSIRSENAAINAISMDFDLQNTTIDEMAVHVVAKTLNQLNADPSLENEYYVSSDDLYISRLLPNKAINATYGTNSRELLEVAFDSETLLQGKVQSGKVVFENLALNTTLSPNDVEVRVSLAGLGKESIQVIGGTDISTKFSHEIGGIVSRVGSAVQDFAKGDRVVGFSLSGFDTRQTTPETLLQKVQPSESLAELTGLPMAYSSALYGLHNLAHIQSGEAVLVLPGTGFIGAAAIEVIKASGAIPYVLTSSESETAFIKESHGLEGSQVMTSLQELLTHLRGPQSRVDIVLGSASTPATLSREAWRHIASFGRYIDCGRKRVLKRNTLDPVPFQRGASYHSFDILELCKSRPNVASQILSMAIGMYRSHQLHGWKDVQLRNIADINEAVAEFQDSFGAAKTLLEYQEYDSPLQVVPSVPTAEMNPSATYLLVGCLGGLGRSLTLWMMKRGARNFCFLSRSGADAKDASILVKELETAGANVQVVRGDVGVLEDVKRAVGSIPDDRPLRGIVHAAMVLRVSSC